MSDASDALVQRIRAGRRRRLPLADNRRALVWRLPDWEEQVRLARGGIEAGRAALGLVDGWEGFTERDLVAADMAAHFADTPVAFESQLLELAVAADMSLLTVLLEGVNAEKQRTKAAQEAASGN